MLFPVFFFTQQIPGKTSRYATCMGRIACVEGNRRRVRQPVWLEENDFETGY